MNEDPIVTEIRRFRQQHAESFDYDLRRIFDDLKQSEQRRERDGGPLLRPPRDAARSPGRPLRSTRLAHR